jgi:predicted membrane protein
MGNNNSGKISGSALFGLLLVALGALWVLNNTNVIVFRFDEWWPLILVAIGLIHLANRRCFFDLTGWLFIGVGAVFFLTENDILDGHEVWKYWPVILILVGLSIIFKRAKPHRAKFYEDEPYEDKSHESKLYEKETPRRETVNPTLCSRGRIDETAIFTGINTRVNSKDFGGGSLSAIFGSVEIDFTEAELGANGAVLDCTAIFGSVELCIPKSWTVDIQSTAIFAGVDRKYSNVEGTEGKRLIIDATAIFGGVEVKN